MPSPFRYFYKESLLTIYTERQKNLPFCCANRPPQSGYFPLCVIRKSWHSPLCLRFSSLQLNVYTAYLSQVIS